MANEKWQMEKWEMKSHIMWKWKVTMAMENYEIGIWRIAMEWQIAIGNCNGKWEQLGIAGPGTRLTEVAKSYKPLLTTTA